MSQSFYVIFILIHIACFAAVWFYARGRVCLSAAFYFVMLIFPVFGPVIGFLAIWGKNSKKDVEGLARLVKNPDEKLYDYRRVSGDYVAAEENLLINEAKDRRKSVLNLLRQDTKQYLEVLKLASYNEDVDTAHYATATLMQVQTDFMNDIKKARDKVRYKDASEEDVCEYVNILHDFINSKLIDADLMVRYRMEMDSAIDMALDKYDCKQLIPIQIDNLIELENLTKAIERCDLALKYDVEPLDTVRKQRIRIYIISEDYLGLHDYLENIKNSDTNLSPDIMREIRFWEEKANTEEGETI